MNAGDYYSAQDSFLKTIRLDSGRREAYTHLIESLKTSKLHGEALKWEKIMNQRFVK